MNICPKDVFRNLAHLLCKERKEQTQYYSHLQKQELIDIPGTATQDERIHYLVGKIQDATALHAS